MVQGSGRGHQICFRIRFKPLDDATLPGAQSVKTSVYLPGCCERWFGKVIDLQDGRSAGELMPQRQGKTVLQTRCAGVDVHCTL